MCAGAVVVRAEQTAADAASDTALLRPLDRACVVSVSHHIAEGRAAADSRRAGCAIEESYTLSAGAGGVRTEFTIAGAAGNAVFDSQATALA